MRIHKKITAPLLGGKRRCFFGERGRKRRVFSDFDSGVETFEVLFCFDKLVENAEVLFDFDVKRRI